MLNDDFDEDDLPGGSLDLEKGSSQVGSGIASSYDGGGIDFDDDLMDDAPGHGALELDIPGGGRSMPPAPVRSMAPQPSHAPPAPPAQARGAGGPSGPVVPELAFDAMPSRAPAPLPSRAPAPPPVSSSSDVVTDRTSAAPPSRSGAHHHAVSAPPSSHGVSSVPVASSGTGASGQAPGAAAGSGGYAPAPAASSTGAQGHAGGFHGLPRSGAEVIAKYPEPPSKILEAPRYPIRVVLRQLELRSDLESLRRRRSPDVALYEAALKAYEPKTFRLGMAINCAVLAVATFIFFLPVIMRFIRD